MFSGRLRHCRRAYREVVFDQKQETFFACHMHAFEWFGGVPEKVTPDNLISLTWDAARARGGAPGCSQAVATVAGPIEVVRSEAGDLLRLPHAAFEWFGGVPEKVTPDNLRR